MIWSCRISPPFPTHQYKALPLLHSCNLDRRNGYPFSISLRLCLAEYPGGLVCLWQWNEAFGETSSHANYMLAYLIVLVYIPLVLIALIYSVILLKLKSQKIPGEQSVNAREQRAKRERNVLTMSIAIVLVFTICWLPLTAYSLLVFFPMDSTMISSCGFWYFWSISLFLACSNCAINPCICFIFSGNYRQGLKNLLSC